MVILTLKRWPLVKLCYIYVMRKHLQAASMSSINSSQPCYVWYYIHVVYIAKSMSMAKKNRRLRSSLLGLVWQLSTNQTQYNEGCSKINYLQNKNIWVCSKKSGPFHSLVVVLNLGFWVLILGTLWNHPPGLWLSF